MRNQKSVSRYLCLVVGESPQRAARFHASTLQRTYAFAIAIHIPILLWAVMGYLLASRMFHSSDETAAVISLMCAALIYLVERLVLATPKGWLVNVIRVLMGIVISILGASTVDLFIFEREIIQQLLQKQEAALVAEHGTQEAEIILNLTQKKKDWMQVQEAANCEANGTCGSKVRSVGPVYREIARQANLMRKEYTEAQAHLAELQQANRKALEQWRANPPSADTAGLLARVQALHEYTTQNPAALVAWGLFFILVLLLESMVVFCKMVFSDTVDDEIDHIREKISRQRARNYMDAVTSPAAEVLSMVGASYT